MVKSKDVEEGFSVLFIDHLKRLATCEIQDFGKYLDLYLKTAASMRDLGFDDCDYDNWIFAHARYLEDFYFDVESLLKKREKINDELSAKVDDHID